jgi:RimJ/RimL family protein N-acetyltransferase
MNTEERTAKIESYGAAYEELVEAIGWFPKEMWAFRPSAEAWTIHEIIVHITDSEANSYARCRRLIAEPGESVMAYDEMQWARALDYSAQSTADALELFKWLRRTSYNLIKDQPESVWANTVYHPENGVMTMDDWLDTYERHVREHVAQMLGVYHQWLAPRFYPAGTAVPPELRTDEFVLRPLRATDVELDYAAVMDSREMLRRWGGGSWPSDDFTLAGNLADLEGHESEHESGVAFTYTVMNPAETECLGCVYITPFRETQRWLPETDRAESEQEDDFTAVCRFWARASRLEDGLDGRLLAALQKWFGDDWAFERLFFRANSNEARQLALLEEAGLAVVYDFEIAGRNGRYVIYG